MTHDLEMDALTNLSGSSVTPPEPNTVVIVDDHLVVLRAVEDIFTSEGFKVLGTAQDESACIELVRKCVPALLVADLNLEDRGNGLSMIATIHKDLPDTRIIIFSMREHIQSAAGAFRAGANAYIYKSSDPYRLIDAARSTSNGGIYYLPGQAEQLATYYAQNSPEFNAIQNMNEKDRLIFRLLAAGHTNTTVAMITHNTEKTIANRAADISKRLGCVRRDFTRIALLYGLISESDLVTS